MKYVTFFDEKIFENDVAQLGGKGAGLKQMTLLGLPVPPGFTILVSAWKEFDETGKISIRIKREIIDAVRKLEKNIGSEFAIGNAPFFVAVRSGAKFSMPGMMDTVLNVGINCRNKGDAINKLLNSITSVFKSWNNPSAVSYRQQYGISDDLGTAVTVQMMVFGNRPNSGAGVVFTRDTNNGENILIGDFGQEMQGEEIVAGKEKLQTLNMELFKATFPKQYAELYEYCEILEKKYKDVQDIEFVIENGKLWLLQTRNAKRTSLANVKISHDLWKGKIISKEECLARITEHDVEILTRPRFNPEQEKKAMKKNLIGKGIMACPGNMTGRLVVDVNKITSEMEKGQKVILLSEYLDPNDISLISKASGIITMKGTPSSHIALILRSVGIPSIVGCSRLSNITEGMDISINADLGNVYVGRMELIETPILKEELKALIDEKLTDTGKGSWVDALYEDKKAPDFRKLINDTSDFAKHIEKKWQSPKAHVIELLNHVFKEGIFFYNSELFRSTDLIGIRKAAKKLFDKKYVTFLRTCYNPHPLYSTPYSAEIASEEGLEKFLTNENFPGKYGGYPLWLKDKRLEAIEVVCEPAGKLDLKLYPEHFACTVLCQRGKVSTLEINLSLGHPHLREFENITKRELITISIALNELSQYKWGDISYHIGSKFIDQEKAKKIQYNNSKFSLKELIERDALPDLDYRLIIKNDVLQLIDSVLAKIKEMWQPPYYLPYKMACMDSVADLSILEAQGRFKNGKLIWFKVYGAKGTEERAYLKNIK